MKAAIHPNYIEASVKCSCGNTFTTRSTKDELHVELQRVPPVLHRQAEAGGHRRSRGALPAPLRAPGLEEEVAGRGVAEQPRYVGGQAVMEGVMMRGAT